MLLSADAEDGKIVHRIWQKCSIERTHFKSSFLKIVVKKVKDVCKRDTKREQYAAKSLYYLENCVFLCYGGYSYGVGNVLGQSLVSSIHLKDILN